MVLPARRSPTPIHHGYALSTVRQTANVSSQKGMRPQLLAYLDHNVLDVMSKGDPDNVAGLLKRASLTAVFSDENLAEIRRSTGFEQTFLEVLERIEARYLVPTLDNQFKHTGKAEVRTVNPPKTYRAYAENVNALPTFGFGLSGMLQKLYGGRQSQSFEEIFSGGVGELRDLLMKLREDLASAPEVNDQARAQLEQVVADLPQLMKEQYASVASQLDSQPLPAVKQFEQATGLGPKVLKNVQRPDVVRKVWALVQKHLEGVEPDMEVFFGIKPFPFEADADREKTTLEKVNAIYHQLNFLGYYRDSKMSKDRRFTASISDMTHAGLASFCDVLICRDEDLMMKAAAAYEYLGVGTRILYYGANS
jgi:hypothetical protein